MVARATPTTGGSVSGSEERQADDTHSPYWGEHVARYERVLPAVHAQRVLDVACGSGYGLRMLSSVASAAIGLDVDPTAVEAAKRHGCEAVLGDGKTLPFDSASFDVITSFETVEHIVAAGEFIAELRRVLKPTGTLFLSTPNALYTRPINGKPANPYHVHEYTPPELSTLLSAQFSSVALAGQCLGAHFGFPPFYDDQVRLPRTPLNVARLTLWKLAYRLPSTLRDRVSRVVTGHAFFPSANDFRFDAARLADAPVLFAVCS